MISRATYTRPVSPTSLVPESYEQLMPSPPAMPMAADRSKRLTPGLQVALCGSLAALSAAQNLLIEASRTNVSVCVHENQYEVLCSAVRLLLVAVAR